MRVDPDAAAELNRLIDEANVARWTNIEEPAAAHAERKLEILFRTSHTLAVYGTLAPGRPNYHVVAPLGGEWTEGVIEGDLIASGWGATFGFPAFRPRPGGKAVAVHVLRAPALSAAWATLDRFEGAEYRRVLVPVFSAEIERKRELRVVANVYAAAQPFE